MKKLKTGLKHSAYTLAAIILALLFWPVSIDPVAYETGPVLTGIPPYEHNNALAQARLVPVDGHGPEGLARGSDNRLYTGFHDGRIVAFDEVTGESELLANTGGRPLAIMFDGKGNLIICDAVKGLLSLSPDRQLTVLVDGFEGVPLRFVDALDIDRRGHIWFSDATTKFGINDTAAYTLESKKTGRLFRYDPVSGEVELVLDTLGFANGVALSPDEDFVLVNETARYRVTRHWLKGPKAGTTDVFLDNLPGFPDNLTAAPNGGYWLALVQARDSRLDRLSDKPFLRKAVYRLMAFFGVGFEFNHSWVVKLSENGEVEMALDAKNSNIYAVTNVVEMDGRIYLSSLTAPHIGILDIPGRN